jgi:DNA primase
MIEDYLLKRNISIETQKVFGVHGDKDNRVVIPVHDENGNFLFNKYRRSPLVEVGSKYTYDFGGKVSLYGWSQAKGATTILLCEGELEVLVAHSKNVSAVSSTGGAMSFQKEWVELFKDKELIVVFDNDKAGGDGMVKVLEFVPHAKIMFIPDMPNVKDCSDYISVGGDLQELLKTSRTFKDMAEVVEDRIRRIALFQSVHFHDAYIKKHTKVPTYTGTRKTSLGSDKVTHAKEYPITQLIEFDSFKKTICPFHAEKSASLVYYPKTNTCYCFGGCGKAYDSIDIYRHKKGCTFTEAVNYLSNN